MWDITGNDAVGYRVYDNAAKRFTHEGTIATLEGARREVLRVVEVAYMVEFEVDGVRVCGFELV